MRYLFLNIYRVSRYFEGPLLEDLVALVTARASRYPEIPGPETAEGLLLLRASTWLLIP
jgi:hypothetical protein